MPATTPRRRGRPLKGEVPLASAERSQRWRKQQFATKQTRLEIWLPVEVVKRIKQEAASSKKNSKSSLGAIVAAHLQRASDGQRYQAANREALQLLEPLRGTGVRATTLEAVIEVLKKPLLPASGPDPGRQNPLQQAQH